MITPLSPSIVGAETTTATQSDSDTVMGHSTRATSVEPSSNDIMHQVTAGFEKTTVNRQETPWEEVVASWLTARQNQIEARVDRMDAGLGRLDDAMDARFVELSTRGQDVRAEVVAQVHSRPSDT
ncbi:hypothetical protein, variant 4 [Aphanomyces invadans]|uniref:Uncharacterized protein n=1 Tax=Aphanomyces invadans TaxID=157072 RepID=A0A024U6E8_9STRA|nr:hypothetical protein, variant 3 [Aphanomyces invadans]XP_008870191.1 hypothetical protein, variant 4 [Aphanomyces invadans]ETW01192.1 hypothetical protein, variant 3 [Aphanomyces invadans]ETW01193.1 hypothetical protein, variant 4 [Aphanomyces invadans]|eukprot:XP_008870190.1 hypothetical protein, variant 3 [Aphanomyces invadans]